jgi:hypothetical protein
MSNQNLLTKWALKVVVAGVLVIGAPQLALAQARPIWMATSAAQAPLAGTGHGRLAVINGELAYDSNAFSWRIALSEIKRISASKQVSNALEVESFGGQRYFVGILDGQLTLTSPGKAVRMLQQAVRSAPAPQPVRTAMVAAGGGVH